jgi:hypothetical protein
MPTAAVATAAGVCATKAARMATTNVSFPWRASPERLVMPFVQVMIFPVMVVSEIRIVPSTPPSGGVVGGVSITWRAIVVISGFTTPAYSKA